MLIDENEAISQQYLWDTAKPVLREIHGYTDRKETKETKDYE